MNVVIGDGTYVSPSIDGQLIQKALQENKPVA
jgi:hypothetical protein